MSPGAKRALVNIANWWKSVASAVDKHATAVDMRLEAERADELAAKLAAKELAAQRKAANLGAGVKERRCCRGRHAPPLLEGECDSMAEDTAQQASRSSRPSGAQSSHDGADSGGTTNRDAWNEAIASFDRRASLRLGHEHTPDAAVSMDAPREVVLATSDAKRTTIFCEGDSIEVSPSASASALRPTPLPSGGDAVCGCGSALEGGVGDGQMRVSAPLWEAGFINKVNVDGSYAIVLATGGIAERVAVEDIRLRTPPTPQSEIVNNASDLESDDSEEIDIGLSDRTRPFDARAGWYWNVTKHPIQLFRAPSLNSDTLAYAILPGMTVRAEERRRAVEATAPLLSWDVTETTDMSMFILVAGKWGKGWAPMRGLHRVAAGSVMTSFEYEAAAVAPADKCVVPRLTVLKRQRRTGIDNFSKALHRFRTLESLCPEEGITRDVIAHVFPVRTTKAQLDSFMERYDEDEDGRLRWEEYKVADFVVRATWRYRSKANKICCTSCRVSRGLWGRFADADTDLNGFLTANELASFLPITLSTSDAPAWLARFDRSGAHGVITISDIAALEAATRRDDILTIVGASMSMAIFVAYIRTSKSIMLMFSTETVEGVPYLKSDLGRPAYTPEHNVAIGIAAVYGALFIVGLPVFGAYTLYLHRNRLKGRHIQSIFGFLFIGYKDNSFYWEFMVLIRKISFLAVALFWEDPFLQSIVGLFVIILSIMIHMAVWPYQQLFLNVVELMSLFSLFSLVVLSVLLWYVQQPGKTNHLEVYETCVTIALFFQFALITTLLVLRYIYCMVREASAAIITKAGPRARHVLERAAYFERWAHWQLFKRRHDVPQSELWSFIAADKRAAENGEAADEVALKKSRRSLVATLSGVRVVVRDTLQRTRHTHAQGNTAWTAARRVSQELMPLRNAIKRLSIGKSSGSSAETQARAANAGGHSDEGEADVAGTGSGEEHSSAPAQTRSTGDSSESPRLPGSFPAHLSGRLSSGRPRSLSLSESHGGESPRMASVDQMDECEPDDDSDTFLFSNPQLLGATSSVASAEVRRDADGCLYTHSEFMEYYGDESNWHAAADTGEAPVNDAHCASVLGEDEIPGEVLEHDAHAGGIVQWEAAFDAWSDDVEGGGD